MTSHQRETVAPGLVKYTGPRGVKWSANLYVDGRRISKTFPERKAAERWLDEQRRALKSEAWTDPTGALVTVEAYLNDWIELADIGPRTRDLYAYLADRHIIPTFGEMRLIDVKPKPVRRWHARLRESSPSNAAKSYRLLRSVFGQAVRDGVLLVNPIDVDRGGKEEAPERPLVDVGDALRAIEALPADLRLAGLLAAFCGLRRGELIELRRKDVDLMRRTIRVDRSAALVRVANGPKKWGRVVLPPKSAAGRRVVAVPRSIAGELEEHLLERVEADAEALLFTNSRGEPLQGGRLSWEFTAAARATGIPGVRFHDLRHMAGTLQAQSGATLKELMTFLGHGSTNAALRYQHAAQSRAELLAEQMSAVIDAAREAPTASVATLRPRENSASSS